MTLDPALEGDRGGAVLMVWWRAFEALARLVRLGEHEVLPPAVPALPWAGGLPVVGRVHKAGSAGAVRCHCIRRWVPLPVGPARVQ